VQYENFYFKEGVKGGLIRIVEIRDVEFDIDLDLLMRLIEGAGAGEVGFEF
jgi:hypothetical protein